MVPVPSGGGRMVPGTLLSLKSKINAGFGASKRPENMVNGAPPLRRGPKQVDYEPCACETGESMVNAANSAK